MGRQSREAGLLSRQDFSSNGRRNLRSGFNRCILAVMDAGVNFRDPAPAPEYSPGGVDISLIRWMLTLTPAERLKFLEDRIDDLNRIRNRNAGT